MARTPRDEYEILELDHEAVSVMLPITGTRVVRLKLEMVYEGPGLTAGITEYVKVGRLEVPMEEG